MKALTFLGIYEGVSICSTEGKFYDLKNKQCRLRSVWNFSEAHSKPNRPACSTKRVNVTATMNAMPLRLEEISVLLHKTLKLLMVSNIK